MLFKNKYLNIIYVFLLHNILAGDPSQSHLMIIPAGTPVIYNQDTLVRWDPANPTFQIQTPYIRPVSQPQYPLNLVLPSALSTNIDEQCITINNFNVYLKDKNNNPKPLKKRLLNDSNPCKYFMAQTFTNTILCKPINEFHPSSISNLYSLGFFSLTFNKDTQQIDMKPFTQQENDAHYMQLLSTPRQPLITPKPNNVLSKEEQNTTTNNTTPSTPSSTSSAINFPDISESLSTDNSPVVNQNPHSLSLSALTPTTITIPQPTSQETSNVIQEEEENEFTLIQKGSHSQPTADQIAATVFLRSENPTPSVSTTSGTKKIKQKKITQIVPIITDNSQFNDDILNLFSTFKKITTTTTVYSLFKKINPETIIPSQELYTFYQQLIAPTHTEFLIDFNGNNKDEITTEYKTILTTILNHLMYFKDVDQKRLKENFKSYNLIIPEINSNAPSIEDTTDRTTFTSRVNIMKEVFLKTSSLIQRPKTIYEFLSLLSHTSLNPQELKKLHARISTSEEPSTEYNYSHLLQKIERDTKANEYNRNPSVENFTLLYKEYHPDKQTVFDLRTISHVISAIKMAHQSTPICLSNILKNIQTAELTCTEKQVEKDFFKLLYTYSTTDSIDTAIKNSLKKQLKTNTSETITKTWYTFCNIVTECLPDTKAKILLHDLAKHLLDNLCSSKESDIQNLCTLLKLPPCNLKNQKKLLENIQNDMIKLFTDHENITSVAEKNSKFIQTLNQLSLLGNFTTTELEKFCKTICDAIIEQEDQFLIDNPLTKEQQDAWSFQRYSIFYITALENRSCNRPWFEGYNPLFEFRHDDFILNSKKRQEIIEYFKKELLEVPNKEYEYCAYAISRALRKIIQHIDIYQVAMKLPTDSNYQTIQHAIEDTIESIKTIIDMLPSDLKRFVIISDAALWQKYNLTLTQ